MAQAQLRLEIKGFDDGESSQDSFFPGDLEDNEDLKLEGFHEGEYINPMHNMDQKMPSLRDRVKLVVLDDGERSPTTPRIQTLD